jgi:transcriptional regulator with XRE-family HTH domain
MKPMPGSTGEAGMLVKRIRQDRRWTQRALAGSLGVAQASVSQYESGRVAPSRRVLVRLHAIACNESQKLEIEELLRKDGDSLMDVAHAVNISTALLRSEDLRRWLQVGPSGKPINPNGLLFINLASSLIPANFIDESVCDLLGLWLKYGNPKTALFFREAAAYIQVRLQQDAPQRKIRAKVWEV